MTRRLTYGAGMLFAALLALSSSAPARADEVMNKAVIDEGHTVYTNHCAVCHGKDGKGGGSMAKSVRPWKTYLGVFGVKSVMSLL